MVLLSTVVMHHHHNERICVAFEMCVHGTDADIEAEGEANHSHRENGSCRIHQLHKFIINSSVAKNLRRHIADGNMLAAILPSACITDTDSRTGTMRRHTWLPPCRHRCREGVRPSFSLFHNNPISYAVS